MLANLGQLSGVPNVTQEGIDKDTEGPKRKIVQKRNTAGANRTQHNIAKYGHQPVTTNHRTYIKARIS